MLQAQLHLFFPLEASLCLLLNEKLLLTPSPAAQCKHRTGLDSALHPRAKQTLQLLNSQQIRQGS